MRIDDIKKREENWQKKWTEAQLFEATPDDREKFFCTFPYPYVNGLPHVGHLFSIMRVEAFARYKRAQGYNVLFPQGWHATGSPIASAANRVAEKEEKQIQILKDLGIKDTEIKHFAKPEYWIEYFVPRYKQDLAAVGMAIDWRRDFHTTSLNPNYDAFIRWQFNTLKEKGYVREGEHPVVWCPKDNVPVGDHDRLSGEGETPQEFLLVKHKLANGRFVISATLRPDTILGITNLYVNPETTYKEIEINEERWILGATAAQRLAEQGHKVKEHSTVSGKDLIGKETEEFGSNTVPILPATFLDPHFGTGLVHSVPSDSADDLIALQDFQKDEAAIKKYGLAIKKVQAITPIEVLDTEGIGGNPAQHFLDKYNVKHQKDRKKLDEIRKELYKLSFYAATFNKRYKKYDLVGISVQEGKAKIQQAIIDEGWATPYYQLTGKVVCRCQTEAIVKIVSNQWFMAYDDPTWKKLAHEAVDRMRFYPEKVRSQFTYVVDWLRAWACTREFGLGTRLPWDEKWLIESLSDSTIYMAYYTIAHKIKDIPAEQLTHEFFDYVFLGRGKTPDVPDIDTIRKEFLYWYPLDFRNSGKDLVQNHLTFMLFSHCGIFPKEHWPKSIGVNGWVTVNGQKMSKSLGNVIPVRTLLADYGADATRMTILNGGEGLDDPNWDSDFARGMAGKLEQLIKHAAECKTLPGADTPVDDWLVSTTNKLIKQVTDAMEATNFRTALQIAFFEYNNVLRWYKTRTKPNGKLLRGVLAQQLVMVAPFIPHAAEEAWQALGMEGFVSAADWPSYNEAVIDEKLDVAEAMIKYLTESFQKKNATNVTLVLAEEWKRDAYAAFDKHVETTRHPGELFNLLENDFDNKEELQRLVKFLVKSRTPSYIPTRAEEQQWLEHAQDYFTSIGVTVTVEEGEKGLPGRPGVILA